ncbi:hypothetical protein ACLI4Y_14905 [Natrialbaceae archaeon A-CW3]
MARLSILTAIAALAAVAQFGISPELMTLEGVSFGAAGTIFDGWD